VSNQDPELIELVAAARRVDRWLYEEDALWVEMSEEQVQEADADAIALHDALVGFLRANPRFGPSPD
jgi:hypothetical protein